MDSLFWGVIIGFILFGPLITVLILIMGKSIGRERWVLCKTCNSIRFLDYEENMNSKSYLCDKCDSKLEIRVFSKTFVKKRIKYYRISLLLVYPAMISMFLFYINWYLALVSSISLLFCSILMQIYLMMMKTRRKSELKLSP